MVEGLNKSLFNQAKKYLIGGVNSPVRSFRAVVGGPIFIKSGRGSKIHSDDGREFIDYCQSFGALILGHAHPKVINALSRAIKKGTSFGATTKSEIELAKLIREAMPSLERLRLTNSGTEAVMGAVRLARAFTGKTKIIKFYGAYHGHADYLLDCPGIPQDFKKHTLSVPYNDLEKVKALVKAQAGHIAAIIVEPVAANTGVVLPREGFLRGLREISSKYNALLIFDEVISGFRVAFGGAQGLFGIKPDLTCLGKIIGGGLSVGAFGGRYEIMRLLAPEGNVYQAGTFSGNPLTVNAGLAVLKTLAKGNPYAKLERQTKHLCAGIGQTAKSQGTKARANFIGSMFSVSFSDTGLFKKFYHALLKGGVYLSPSGLEANFISTAHTDRDIDNTIQAINKALLRKGG